MKNEQDLIKPNTTDSNRVPVTSPFSSNNLVSKVNSLTSAKSVVSINPAQNIISNEKSTTLDYKTVINEITNMFPVESLNKFYSNIYSVISKNIDSAFIAIGIFKESSNCINLKLEDKLGNYYSSKVFLKDIENPIIQAFNEKEIIYKDNADFLKLAYFKNNKVIILPLISVNECIGVMITEDNYARQNAQIYKIIANYVALVSHNFDLAEKSKEYVNTDSLTLLYNHRGFQEILSNEINRADANKNELSILMMDICNITQINRELGHAKGDEVIKLVADKIRQNIREGDTAGRYGGDEIAVILPNTSVSQAKYIAEYLTYTLSCFFIDDVGPVKVSVGISTYPNVANDKEKLLILAEQAMYISKAKGYKDGMSAIISSTD